MLVPQYKIVGTYNNTTAHYMSSNQQLHHHGGPANNNYNLELEQQVLHNNQYNNY